MDARLGTPENKAMRLPTTSFFTLLLLGFAGGSYGQGFEDTKLLAEQGNARAQLNLGVMYAKGEGISVNDVEAIRWIGLAAKQGNIGAQYSLGFMYHQGEGVLQNNVRAYVWYSVVAAQGEAEALISRDIVSEELTPDQLAQAQQIAAKCFESDYQDCE